VLCIDESYDERLGDVDVRTAAEDSQCPFGHRARCSERFWGGAVLLVVAVVAMNQSEGAVQRVFVKKCWARSRSGAPVAGEELARLFVDASYDQ